MAEIAVVSGNTITGVQIGRDILWIAVTATNAILNNALPDVDGVTPSLTSLDQIRKVIDQYCTITLIGEQTTTAVMFMVEGLGVQEDPAIDPITLQEQLDQLELELEALVPDLGEITVTQNRILGVAFDILLTSA